MGQLPRWRAGAGEGRGRRTGEAPGHDARRGLGHFLRSEDITERAQCGGKQPLVKAGEGAIAWHPEGTFSPHQSTVGKLYCSYVRTAK